MVVLALVGSVWYGYDTGCGGGLVGCDFGVAVGDSSGSRGYSG